MVVFDKTWWIEHGPTYKAEVEAGKHGPAEAYVAQEAAVIKALRELEFNSVLEIGAGFGRLTRLVRPLFVGDYLATDVSDESLNQMDSMFVTRMVLDLDKIEHYEELETYDLVLCAEVLMHREKVRDDLYHLLKLCNQYVVLIDWWEPGFTGESPGCYMHDYAAILDFQLAWKSIDIPEARQRIWITGK